ncbi:hypothetical protein AAFC00_000845 [Neodothiora populina]|uniref:Altered inheritance of mitochondria protein 9, mitochondrial n=1 Tax=Neodothiora populina TaxID=2781224 RepID=A0ABR3PLY1_9PEZI
MPKGLQGPWKRTFTYLATLESIARSAVSGDKARQTSVDNHLQLLDVNRGILGAITDLQVVRDASRPVLFHPDFHARNIFVSADEPTQITGIIDWQSAAVEPAYVYAAETPDFAEELFFDETLDAEHGADMDAAHADTQSCNQAWIVMSFLCPKLGKAVNLDPVLLQYLASIHSGDLDNNVSLCSELTDISQRWTTLGLPGDSPYKPSQEDAEALETELDELYSTQRLKLYLARLLRCQTDGWVETEKWEEVVPIYRAEYEAFVRSCNESRDEGESESNAVATAERLWPLNMR